MIYRKDLHKHSVVEALYELDVAIGLARRGRMKIVMLVVGYGAGGSTHKIKTAILERLEYYDTKRQIKGFLPGEYLDIFNVNYQKFKYKDLLRENKCEYNKGVIYIVV